MTNDWLDFHDKWVAMGESPYLHLCECPECLAEAARIMPTRDVLQWKPIHED
jgi:hypothetical protein